MNILNLYIHGITAQPLVPGCDSYWVVSEHGLKNLTRRNRIRDWGKYGLDINDKLTELYTELF